MSDELTEPGEDIDETQEALDLDDVTLHEGDRPAENESADDSVPDDVRVLDDINVLELNVGTGGNPIEIREELPSEFVYTDDTDVIEIPEAVRLLQAARQVDEDEDAYVLLDKHGQVIDRFRTDVPFGIELVDGQTLVHESDLLDDDGHWENDDELPGMWEHADFLGGPDDSDESED